MKKTKIKAIKYGGTDTEVLHVRAQGVRVRMQDMESGLLFQFDPVVARRLADALKYAAHHAEHIVITPEIKELLDGHGSIRTEE